MGNSISIEFNTKLDEYAGKCILNLSKLNDLNKLNDANECNKLIIRIAEMIEKITPQTELKRVLHHITNKNGGDHSIELAKFYVKIAHVYASIAKTINPVKGVASTTFCGSRLFSLLDGGRSSMGGIPELDMLYNDSKYDSKSGKFNGRSDKMDTVYRKNLETFYMTFTGSSTMDYNIKKFTDIKISDYSKKDTAYSVCEDCSDDALFEQYADTIAGNLKHINDSQTKLTEILLSLFHKRTINPELTDITLSTIISTARDIIINLYLTCEQNYAKGIAIYEAISNKKILDTWRNQQNELIKRRIELVTMH